MSKHNREEVLEKAEKDLGAVMDQHMARLVKELEGTDFWKLRRAYSPGVDILSFSFCMCAKKEFLIHFSWSRPYRFKSILKLQHYVIFVRMGLF
jgi:hypothetical protein